MPSKTTTKSSKKPKNGLFTKVKALATGKAKPFLAVLIVLGVVGLGYYGYLRSSADTLSNTPPTVKCAAKLTNKECNQKQAESDAAFYAQLGKDCNAANRKFSGTSCGACQGGFFDNNGTCKARAKVDCAAQNRKQTDDYNCGDCKATYTLSGTACVPKLVNSAALCALAFKNYDATANACTTCKATYTLSGTTCVPDSTTTPVPPTACGGQGQAACEQATGVYCAGLHRVFVAKTKTCGACVATFTQVGTDLTTACQPVLTPDQQCAFNGSGNCLPVATVRKLCADSHRQYDAKNNLCKDDCVSGWYFENNVCNKVSTVDPAKVKAGCDKLFLRYDKDTNRCLTTCKATYVMRDNKCVEWTEASMTKWRCDALGRDWIPATEADGDVAGMPALCATKCESSTAKFVDTGNDDNSYCKAGEAAGAGVGVTPGMTREQCTAQHRAWITALEGCSARCQADWYLNDGKCTEVKVPANDTTDGDGAAGGCSTAEQTVRLAVRGTADGPVVTAPEVTICPDDDPVDPPANTPADQPVTHDVAVLMDHATCTKLGRVWVPDSNTVGKKVKGGCSTQECLVKGAEVRRSNGSAYCEGSVDRIAQKECNKAHRDWIEEVNACAARIGGKDSKTKVNAMQCDPPYTVYVQHTKEQGVDECVKPSVFQRIQGVAQTTGKPVSFLASLGPKGLCNVQKNKQWIDGKCVKKRVPNPSSSEGPTANGGGSGGSSGSQGGSGGSGSGSSGESTITAAWCRDNLRRGYDATAKTCSRSCAFAGEQITNYTDSSKWDVCKRATVCDGWDQACTGGGGTSGNGNQNTGWTTKTIPCSEYSTRVGGGVGCVVTVVKTGTICQWSSTIRYTNYKTSVASFRDSGHKIIYTSRTCGPA
ncbi:MAG: hypothetical protein JWN82_137 [Candidatus Saccharibacteria bacterium]|nr:hypothetical protein [Candidatus Saccharibacteria bacterium]